MIEDVAALVLLDPDIGAVDVICSLYDGTLVSAKALITELAESPDQLKSAFSRSGLNAWISAAAVPDYSRVQYLVTAEHVTYRVLDREREADSVRLMLASTEGISSFAGDFSGLDFSDADFDVRP